MLKSIFKEFLGFVCTEIDCSLLKISQFIPKTARIRARGLTRPESGDSFHRATSTLAVFSATSARGAPRIAMIEGAKKKKEKKSRIDDVQFTGSEIRRYGHSRASYFLFTRKSLSFSPLASRIFCRRNAYACRT